MPPTPTPTATCAALAVAGKANATAKTKTINPTIDFFFIVSPSVPHVGNPPK
jgi:hypothetical protein